ncbi:hypothetical protein [Hominisplanchenecus sp.]|uniref:hypothetical protein n=1 Tax=Hominisplanchenecus sp. TaxID=3038130 RepID=UPI003992F63A
MSMTTLVILRFLGIFAAYMGVTLALPALMFRRILRGRSLAEQFLMCYTFGNFYIINIVFLLQLLHISNFLTLAGLTAVLSIVIGGRVNRIPLKQQAGNTWHLFGKLLRGRMKLKSAIFLFLGKCAEGIKRLAKFFYRHIVKNPIQSMLLLGIGVCLCWIYGRQIILVYGYRASDIPVHMSWINEMSRGKIFAKGVYPFGFHCIIYYLHAVFRFDTYVILCQFFFAQVIFMHLVLLAMMKQLCKTKYIPYIGTFVFLLGNFWSGQTYSRFYATLPQEFGMIFVIPSIYFLIRFFQIPKQKLANKETRLTLQCFAMTFSLTLAIHFYGTMIAGLCCIGIACGFCFRFLRKEYFRRIMFTGICSVFLAVLPMGIAFATGTPLQGSLGWGLSVINGGKSSSSTETEADEAETLEVSTGDDKNTVRVVKPDGTVMEIDVSDLPSAQENESGGQTQTETTAPAVPKVSFGEKIRKIPGKAKNALSEMSSRILEFIIKLDVKNIGYMILASFALLLLLGLVFCIFRQPGYGAMLMSMGFCMWIVTILLCAGVFGLPPLMDGARCSIYYVYLLSAALTALADGLLYMVLPLRKLRLVRNAVSLAVAAAVLMGMFQNHMIKQSDFSSGFVMNGVITCLSNIIHENEDKTWTIVSANDETQMGVDHGWHYETITFLRGMETLEKNTKVIIPTKTVYFFIEKIPLDYSVTYDKSGQSISRKGASRSLPNVGGIGMYQGEGRWIVMSRMYYWAQAFMELYPNEMKVYYEDNKFICYKIEQNMYHQYDFAIDYRYNQNKMQDETAEDTQDETQQQSEATNETQQQSDASGKQEAGK